MSEDRPEKVIEDKKSGKERWMADRRDILDEVMKGRQEAKEQFFKDMESIGVERDMFEGKRIPTVPAVRTKIIEMIRGHGQKVAEDVLEIADYYERQLLGRDKTIANLKERNERRKFYR